MKLKITSTHKTESNVDVANFFVSIAEFYIGVTANDISLRCNIFTEDAGIKYPVDLLPTDVLVNCISQDLKVSDYATKTATLTATGTVYQIQAQLLFALIYEQIAAVNAVTPGRITYQIINS